MRKILSLLTFMLFFTSCMEVASNRQLASVDQGAVGDGGSGGDGGNGAVPGDGTVDPDSIEEVEAKVEIRHLIEPKIDDNGPGGTYTRKLTIPKNYNEHLYLAGINVSTLSDRIIKVRFKFGLDSSPITVPATLATAPGLTPQTDVEVLVLDMRSEPFRNIRLVYDLFDYNEYEFGATDPEPGVLSEPVQFNRDEKLYCRGLKLEDDPTFDGTLANGCNGPEAVCKYAYAKIMDKGLVQENWISPTLPTELNIATEFNLSDDPNSVALERCLPNNPSSSMHSIGATDFPFSASFNSGASEWEIAAGSLTPLFDGGTQYLGSYYYQGPYFATNTSNWEIGDSALLGEYGVFKRFLSTNTVAGIDSAEIQFGAESRLFPLESKFNLASGVQYMGSSIPGDPKALMQTASNTESQWMDGCNERISSMLNDYNGEHVGSCSVTAKIEIIAIDDDGEEKVVDVSDEVKLQLVKTAQLNTDGDNVLLSSFQSCSSSGQCGSDSCCISGRCWSKSIVSQCVEDLPSYGNLSPGDSCQSDNQCASLCCNQATGQCAVHDTLSDPAVYCSKPSGQSCIAKEWCMKHPVTQCFIVNTGFDAQGQRTCAQRCYTYEKHGDCQSSAGSVVGICVPPEQPSMPVFNPADPNRCDNAIDPSQVPVN